MNDQGRILNIFLRLFFGEKLQKKSLADEFEVNERTIQRDLSFLRYFVSVHSSILGNLVYNRDIKKIFNRSTINYRKARSTVYI